MTPEEVLHLVGQPKSRVGSTFTYCVDGADEILTFDAAGRLIRAAAPVAPPAPPTGELPATGGPPAAAPLVGVGLLLVAGALRRARLRS